MVPNHALYQAKLRPGITDALFFSIGTRKGTYYALIERRGKPSGKTEEEKVKLASTIIQRAVRNGMTEVQVYRFPNTLCTDKGRAINQQEAGWENTLTGVPKEIYHVWHKHFRPRGYRLRVQIIDFPGGMPGDIAMTLAWE